MDQRKPDLREVKAAAKSKFSKVQGIEGVGLGENSLRLYIRDKEVQKQLPSEFHGVPIVFVVTGEITPLGHS